MKQSTNCAPPTMRCRTSRMRFPESRRDISRRSLICSVWTLRCVHARVLEIGCAAGGNVIPFAALHPESRVVGIDLLRSKSNKDVDALRRWG